MAVDWELDCESPPMGLGSLPMVGLTEERHWVLSEQSDLVLAMLTTSKDPGGTCGPSHWSPWGWIEQNAGGTGEEFPSFVVVQKL